LAQNKIIEIGIDAGLKPAKRTCDRNAAVGGDGAQLASDFRNFVSGERAVIGKNFFRVR
jgi:hypothetical protein